MRMFERIAIFGAFCVIAGAACGGCDDDGAGADGEACETDSDCRGECSDGVCSGGGGAGTNNGTANNGAANNGAANNGTANNATANNGGEVWDPNQTRAEYCMGSGPPVIVGDQGGTATGAVCTGDIAQTTFRFALCVCENYGSSGTLTTDSFDSSMGPYDPNAARAGGAVGINGRYDSSGTANIGGSLWVGSEQGISSGGDVTVENELRTNGSITSSKTFTIARDAYVAGDIAVQDFNVGGSLFTPVGTQVTTQSQVDVVRQDVGAITPCDCNDPLDVAGIVELNRQYNHNDEVGLDSSVVSAFNGDQTIDLECGRFYLDEIVGSGNVTINVTGRTALFIGGDVAIAGELTFAVDDDAVVDVFVAGDLNLSAAYVIGDPNRPASARFYSGGQQISFSQSGTVAGNIYAPYANMTFSAPLEVFGSLFARTLNFSDSLTVHYDEAILTASEDCEDPTSGSGGGSGGNNVTTNNGAGTTGGNNGTGGGTGGDPMMCVDCKDCGNQACNDGECGSCVDSLDCCSPLICYQGSCILVIP